MTIIESMGYEALEEFVETAKEMGICYCGNDIPPSVQSAVIEIVSQYLEEYKEEDLLG